MCHDAGINLLVNDHKVMLDVEVSIVSEARGHEHDVQLRFNPVGLMQCAP